MGWWTVTSLVPSGNVASTWISGIISGTPSMTSPRARIEAGSAMTASPAGLDGHSVFGTLVASAPRIAPETLADCRSVAPRSGEVAITLLPALLVARYRGDSTEAARECFAALWARLREPIMGRAAVAPRIWST